MLSKIINLMVSHINNVYGEYGLNINAQHDADMNVISEFSHNFRYRQQYSDYELFKDSDMDKFKNNSYILMLYNFGAMELDKDRLNNIRFEAVFNNKQNAISSMNRIDTDGELNQLAKYVREINENDDFEVRDMIMCNIPFEFKILTSNIKLMDAIQFIYLSRIMRNNTLPLSIQFSDDTDLLDMEYNTNFEPLSDFSFVDRQKYGDLMQIDFSGMINGPIFSSFSKKEKVLREINMTLNIEY